MNIDQIPSSQLHHNWIQFLKTVDTRIQQGIKAELSYHQQINLILDRICDMKNVGTAFVRLDPVQQELLEKILMKELNS